MSQGAASWDLKLRDALCDRVQGVLVDDDRLDRVALAGSIARGQADVYADIDFVVHLRRGFMDREYFFDLPRLMDAVGPRVIDGWSFTALPHYAATFYFDGVPLLWHVDIGCIPADPEWHVDGSDLTQVKRWEQRFKMWIEAVKRFLRAENTPLDSKARRLLDEYMIDLISRVAKRMDVSALTGEPRDQLNRLIDMEVAWHRSQGLGDESVFLVCDELRHDVLNRVATGVAWSAPAIYPLRLYDC
jgi:predicted nucleotidyltransferase